MRTDTEYYVQFHVLSTPESSVRDLDPFSCRSHVWRRS